MVYNWARDSLPTAPTTRAGTASTPAIPPIDGAREYFRTLLPNIDGSGDYHINHFICYFTIYGLAHSKGEGENIALSLTNDFSNVQKFCSIFSHYNIASVAPGTSPHSKLGTDATVEFKIGGNAGDAAQKAAGLLHSDWVVMRRDAVAQFGAVKSFHGDTLLRYWETEFEKSVDGANKIRAAWVLALSAGPIDAIAVHLLADWAIHELIAMNRRHFLAGTRSWRVGYDKVFDSFFVETITVERFSDSFYEMLDGYAFDYHADVPRIWSHLLNNYIKLSAYKGRKLIATPPSDRNFWAGGSYQPSTDINSHIRFRMASCKPNKANKLAVADAPWAESVLKNHGGLSKHVQF
jgi:hypothetical protein